MAGSRRLTRLSGDVLARTASYLPDGPLVVALSGGADSAVCAWAAGRVTADVRAVHVDHGWPASAALRSAARAVAEHLGIQLSVVEASTRSGPSPEGQARLARYEALEEGLGPDEWLLTGHTMDDQAETVLGNLMRGAGATGLAGIPQRRGRIIRPLLGVTRSETRELSSLLGLPWVDDPTNVDTALRRNLLRRDVIPYLETRVNPSLRAALVRLASTLDEDEQILGAAAESIPVQVDGSMVRLPAALLATVPDPVATRAARRALRQTHHGYPGSSAEVAAILSVARGGPPVELSGFVRVERDGAWVTLNRSDAPRSLPSVLWELPGSIKVGSWFLEAWLEETPPIAFSLSSLAEVFDAETLPRSVTVRSMEPGDSVAIVGGTKPLKVVLAEAQIPPHRRRNWPVVATDREVIWIPGVRRSATGWVGPATTRYLWVRATVEGHS